MAAIEAALLDEMKLQVLFGRNDVSGAKPLLQPFEEIGGLGWGGVWGGDCVDGHV
jgi:hypothetical protein